MTNQTSIFLKILHNGSRKVLQRGKLAPYLKTKHPSTRNTLLRVAARVWNLTSS